MTREELHELVDIVMDAREKGFEMNLLIYGDTSDVNVYYINNVFDSILDIWASDYNDFSDFTQAVKDYIKNLG